MNRIIKVEKGGRRFSFVALVIVGNQKGSVGISQGKSKQVPDAIKKATELENSSSSLNAVYVSSDNPQQLRSAYRNYFYDPVDFVELIESL